MLSIDGLLAIHVVSLLIERQTIQDCIQDLLQGILTLKPDTLVFLGQKL
jgi:hypothetical protein